jgi:ribosome maturation factor RimP
MKNVAGELQDRLDSLVKTMGYEFVGCELQPQGRSSILRIYIDSPQGITLTDCTNVSRQVSAMLDVEDPIQGRYSLEISSPGLNRPLFDLAHYQKQIGQRIKVRLYVPVNRQRNFVGTLIRVEGDKIHLLEDSSLEVVLAFSDIEKARVIADI